MAFVRKKKVRDKHYLQIVENRRDQGKVRQRVLLHVGDYPDAETAVGCWEAGTGKKGDRRVFAYAPTAAEKARKVRASIALNEQAVAAERREAERWAVDAREKFAELTDKIGRRVS